MTIAWRPQAGPQAAYVSSPIFETVYGGARGGGKTDGSLGEFGVHAQRYKADAKGLFIRRTRVALEPTIERAKVIYRGMAEWQEQKSRFLWPNGAVLYFRYLERDQDADNYQGHDYTRLYVEELTQFRDPGPLDKLKATLRSAAGVPVGFRATCNPGGAGHTWVKARHIDPGAWSIIRETFVNPFTNETIETDRVFIPAKLSDNPELLTNDPGYVGRLFQAGSEALVKAWLEGDWNVIEGAFFDGWKTARNTCRAFEIPKHWTRFRSFDWGYARPFSVGWWAISSDDMPGLPKGALVRYREWYGSDGKPNQGLKLEAEKIAAGILERERGDVITYSVADPAIFSSDGGPSIAERMYKAGVSFRKADNARVARNGAIGGWDQMRARIAGDEDGPALVVFDTCRDFIRTVPVLQHDPAKAEDLDTEAEDHVADEARYACMSRPFLRVVKVTTPPLIRGLNQMSINEVIGLGSPPEDNRLYS